MKYLILSLLLISSPGFANPEVPENGLTPTMNIEYYIDKNYDAPMTIEIQRPAEDLTFSTDDGNLIIEGGYMIDLNQGFDQGIQTFAFYKTQETTTIDIDPNWIAGSTDYISN